ncbi:hypothetical protein HDU86_002082, partial [Geranomyces michiganensis]
MEHPRVGATMAAVRENYAFKASVSNVPKSDVHKGKAHPNFEDRAATTKAHWADVVDDLLTPDECTYLAAPETEEEVNPDGSPRTHPLWTLATIRGFWAPVILDVGASRSLISGYEGVLYESADCAPMEEAGFSGVGGNVCANTRVSLGVSLTGKEGEYLSFRGFFCRVKMNEDVILIANDILAPLKVRLTVQLEPLPSFATTLNNPDILISGSISQNLDTKHLNGKRVSTSRGPMVQDLPPTKNNKRTKTNPTFVAARTDSADDHATYLATSLSHKDATQLLATHNIRTNALHRAPDAFEAQLLSEAFDVELACAKPVVWMLVQILRRYHAAFSYEGHIIGHYNRIPYEPSFNGPPPPRTKPRNHSQADKTALQAERDTMMRLGRWERTEDAVYASEAVVIHYKDKPARIAFDYRKVNLRMAWDPYPFPNMWDVLQWLVAVPFRYISGGDANKGFYQCYIRRPE